jgi:hypothetical protein
MAMTEAEKRTWEQLPGVVIERDLTTILSFALVGLLAAITFALLFPPSDETLMLLAQFF